MDDSYSRWERRNADLAAAVGPDVDRHDVRRTVAALTLALEAATGGDVLVALGEGRAWALDQAEGTAEMFEQYAVALRRVVEHVAATHPRARRRARRAAAARTVPA